MKTACAQFAPVHRDIDLNLATLDRLTGATDADIVVFPELALTGYFFRTEDEAAPFAKSADGRLADSIGEIARKHERAIVTGFLEAGDGVLFNSALAFGNNGKLAGHYRKVHRFYFETQVFERGDLGFPVFDLPTRSGSARTGMLICYDWRFPEAARSLAIAGAELIAMPSNIVSTTGMLHRTLQTRAFENKVALAFSDRIGTETLDDETLSFRGESAIINFNGSIVAKASEDQEEIIVAEIDLARTREKRINQFNDLFGDRDPFQYR